MLVALCVLLLLAVVTMGLWAPKVRGDDDGERKPSALGGSLDRAQEVDCTMRLSHLRQWAAAGAAGDPIDPAPPATIDELGSGSEIRCPLCGLKYSYNPGEFGQASQGIHCRYPKHEGL
ncbi:MAG: hypothetical protein GF320_22840 [Armatimonadia bacterium]|jgi:hypothetical protein|nr:hypothetical protein [Armatimonadia bacterium]